MYELEAKNGLSSKYKPDRFADLLRPLLRLNMVSMNNENSIPIKNILVTGMSGLIGGLAGRELARRGYRVSALNRQDVPGFSTTRADITDLDAIRPR